MEILKSKYTDVKFVNLSASTLGNFGLSCSSFIELCDSLAVDISGGLVMEMVLLV